MSAHTYRNLIQKILNWLNIMDNILTCLSNIKGHLFFYLVKIACLL